MTLALFPDNIKERNLFDVCNCILGIDNYWTNIDNIVKDELDFLLNKRESLSVEERLKILHRISWYEGLLPFIKSKVDYVIEEKILI